MSDQDSDFERRREIVRSMNVMDDDSQTVCKSSVFEGRSGRGGTNVRSGREIRAGESEGSSEESS